MLLCLAFTEAIYVTTAILTRQIGAGVSLSMSYLICKDCKAITSSAQKQIIAILRRSSVAGVGDRQ